MAFIPQSDRWQRFPVVTLSEPHQAIADARELYFTIACVAACYGVGEGRMRRALAALAGSWPARPAVGQERRK